MNRRTLIQSLPAVASLHFFAADDDDDENRLAQGEAVALDAAKKYLFLVKSSEVMDIEALAKGLGELGIEGTIQFVTDPKTAMQIYEVTP